MALPNEPSKSLPGWRLVGLSYFFRRTFRSRRRGLSTCRILKVLETAKGGMRSVSIVFFLLVVPSVSHRRPNSKRLDSREPRGCGAAAVRGGPQVIYSLAHGES